MLILNYMITAVHAARMGVGYREQELQLAKGTNFASEEANGVKAASFSGGTHIFFKGDKLNLVPERNQIFLYSEDFKTTFQAPPMSEEDIFNSQPATGSISYRLPSVPALFNLAPDKFGAFTKMQFQMKVYGKGGMMECVDSRNILSSKHLAASKCRITYNRDYTPTIFKISPRVTYFGSLTSVWFNPMNTMTLIKDLEDDELPFINAKIGGNQIDFENRVDADTEFTNNKITSVKGMIGEGAISNSQNITMMWETGNANVILEESI